MVTVTRGRAKEDFVTVFVVGKGNEAEIGEMLKYFFDETVAIKAVGSIEEISGEEGDYVVVYSDADASVLKDMGIAVINATDVQISEDMTNHEKFKCAEEIAKQMCHTIDVTSRKIDGYSQMASFTGEKTFDVDIWGDTACYRVTLVGNATVDINNETYLTWEMEDSLVTYVGAVDGKISVKSQGNVNVTIEPWDSVETEKFEAPTDMELTNTVAGIERYENETRVTIYNTNTEAKKVRIGNSIVTVLPKSAITYEKKVW